MHMVTVKIIWTPNEKKKVDVMAILKLKAPRLFQTRSPSKMTRISKFSPTAPNP